MWREWSFVLKGICRETLHVLVLVLLERLFLHNAVRLLWCFPLPDPNFCWPFVISFMPRPLPLLFPLPFTGEGGGIAELGEPLPGAARIKLLGFNCKEIWGNLSNFIIRKIKRYKPRHAVESFMNAKLQFISLAKFAEKPSCFQKICVKTEPRNINNEKIQKLDWNMPNWIERYPIG